MVVGWLMPGVVGCGALGEKRKQKDSVGRTDGGTWWGGRRVCRPSDRETAPGVQQRSRWKEVTRVLAPPVR
jgi:hypothetical protein